MLRKKIFLTIIIVLFITICHCRLHALGIGFYSTGKAGVSYSKTSNDGFTVNYALGAGFVLDTAVASSDVFNYRLAAGYDNAIDSGGRFFKRYSANRVLLSNVFGFGVIRNKYIRLWTGPQLELGCQFNKVSKSSYYYDSLFGPSRIKSTLDYAYFLLGIGAVMGLNINPGKVFTISLEVGLNTTLGFGKYHAHENHLWFIRSSGSYIVLPYALGDSYDRAFGKVEGFIRLSFIFRIRDNYNPDIIE